MVWYVIAQLNDGLRYISLDLSSSLADFAPNLKDIFSEFR